MGNCRVVTKFFKLSSSITSQLLNQHQVTGAHIAATLVVAAFTGPSGSQSLAGVKSLFTYAKLPKMKARKVFGDLKAMGVVSESEEILEAGVLTITPPTVGDSVAFPMELVTDSSRPLAKVARLSGDAAKLFLHSYMTHDQQVNLCSDPSDYPFQRYTKELIAENNRYGLWITTGSAIENVEAVYEVSPEKMPALFERLVEEGLLNRSIAVFYDEPRELAEVAYNLTSPLNARHGAEITFGTVIKQHARMLGFPVKEGRWVCFAPKGKVPVVAAVYSPAFAAQGPDAAVGLEAFAARQKAAEASWRSFHGLLRRERERSSTGQRN